MWKYRIRPKAKYRAALGAHENKFEGKVFLNEKDAKKALSTLPKEYEIVAFMGTSFNPLA